MVMSGPGVTPYGGHAGPVLAVAYAPRWNIAVAGTAPMFHWCGYCRGRGCGFKCRGGRGGLMGHRGKQARTGWREGLIRIS
jgi:hypothetical protein